MCAVIAYLVTRVKGHSRCPARVRFVSEEERIPDIKGIPLDYEAERTVHGLRPETPKLNFSSLEGK